MAFLFLADGFEEIEAVTVVDILRRANVALTTVSIEPVVTVRGAHDVPLIADARFDDTDFSAARALILPGGRGYQRLLAHSGLTALLKETMRAPAKEDVCPPLLAAICAAPAVLAAHGLLAGRRATIFPGMEDELVCGEANPVNKQVVVDGNIVTSRSPGTALAFALRLAAELTDPATVDQIRASLQMER
jgi:4-methyl-5(b-hydroxyethyl)-thiazole monophosphate biosynthesis